MSEFQPNEIISITVKEARIDCVTTEGHDSDETLVARAMVVGDDGKPYYITVPLEWDTVTVERVAPAEWPPLLGDLWRDRLGSVWFALGRRVLMVPGDPVGDLGGYEPDKVLAKVGPLTLVHREGASS